MFPFIEEWISISTSGISMPLPPHAYHEDDTPKSNRHCPA